jgi:hypothetical protein
VFRGVAILQFQAGGIEPEILLYKAIVIKTYALIVLRIQKYEINQLLFWKKRHMQKK